MLDETGRDGRQTQVRGVLRPMGSSGVPDELGEGVGSAEVLLPSHRDRDLADDLTTEVCLLRAITGEFAIRAEALKPLTRRSTPPGTSPGQAVPLLHGLVPSQLGLQGVRDRQHRPQGPAHVQSRLRPAAHPPRSSGGHRPQAGPQLARISYLQMVERGKDYYLGATCVAAANLAERTWTVMRSGSPP